MNRLVRLFSNKSALEFAIRQREQLLDQRKKWALRISSDRGDVQEALKRIEKFELLIAQERDSIVREVASIDGNFQEFLSIEAQLAEQNATIQKLSSQ